MHNFRFTSFLTSNIDIDETLVNELIRHCTVKEAKKGNFLLQPGEICRHSFFVENGLLRMFGTDDKGKEHILQFAPENWFVTDRESVFYNKPSRFFIQALENSKTLLIDENFMLQLSRLNPAFIEFNNRLLHSHVRQQTQRIYQLLSANAEERYLEFIKVYPDILLRVPQTMVASYLGITPESLSRVRRELAHKNSGH